MCHSKIPRSTKLNTRFASHPIPSFQFNFVEFHSKLDYIHEFVTQVHRLVVNRDPKFTNFVEVCVLFVLGELFVIVIMICGPILFEHFLERP